MTWIYSFAEGVLTILDMLIPVLIGITLLVFIWGVVIFITKSGSEKAHEEAKKRIVWGLIALFVILSMWGLVRLMQIILGTGPAFVQPPFVQYSYE